MAAAAGAADNGTAATTVAVTAAKPVRARRREDRVTSIAPGRGRGMDCGSASADRPTIPRARPAVNGEPGCRRRNGCRDRLLRDAPLSRTVALRSGETGGQMYRIR